MFLDLILSSQTRLQPLAAITERHFPRSRDSGIEHNPDTRPAECVQPTEVQFAIELPRVPRARVFHSGTNAFPSFRAAV